MSYRDIRSSDNLFSKTNRNDRFKQMSKQQQLIEEKKRQIQEKLELQKKKDAEEALKKVHPKDSNSERKALVFSNDGSFLDQFKKLSGMAGTQDRSKTNTSDEILSEGDEDNQRNSRCNEEKSDGKKPFECDNDWRDTGCVQPPSLPPPPLPPDSPTAYPPRQPHPIQQPHQVQQHFQQPHPIQQHLQQPQPTRHLQQPPPHYLQYNLPPPPPPIIPQAVPPPLLSQSIPPPPTLNVPPPPLPPCLLPPTGQFPPHSPLLNLMVPPPNYSAPQVPPENVQQGNGVGVAQSDRFSPSNPTSPEENDSKDWFQQLQRNNITNNVPPIINDHVKVETQIAIKQENEADLKTQQRSERKRKSRWSDDKEANMKPPQLEIVTTVPKIKVTGMSGPMISKVTRTDPGLLQYALTAYGSNNLSEEDWKKAEENYKVHLLYQEMMAKRAEIEKLREAGKNKYEYDSDEEIDEKGTWEHKLREKEMVATQEWAESLTEMAKGKHHIGDFLPPDELKKFMAKYQALKGGGEPDLSDYKEYKLGEENKGFQMLQKLGWSEGQGLGTDGGGRLDPVNKGQMRESNEGLGHIRPDDITNADDEYDAYRKRMMLAYRFRPNPLNNPRRPYY